MMVVILSGAGVAVAPGVTGDSPGVTAVVAAVGASDTACVGGAAPGSESVNEVVFVSRSVVQRIET